MTKTYKELIQENARKQQFMINTAIYHSLASGSTIRIDIGNPMDFSETLILMKRGFEVARLDWIKPVVVEGELIPTVSLQEKPYLVDRVGELRTSGLFLHRQNERGQYHPWIPSSEDLFATDWVVLGKLSFDSYESEDPANDEHVTGEGAEKQ